MKKNLLLFLAIVILGSFAVFAQDPVVTMDSCTNITFAQVKFYGNLVNKGTWTVNGRGFIYSQDPVPTKSNGTVKAVSGTALGSFNSTITTLQPSTTYYVRAYAKQGTTDTVYSQTILSFTTAAATPPTFTTPIISNIGLVDASFSCELTSKGDATLQTAAAAKGFVYSTTPNPTYNNYRVNATTSGSTLPIQMSADLTGLASGTLYYVRAYYIVKYGSAAYDTVYSPQVTFTTQHACGNPPFGVSISDVDITEATVNFNKALGQTRWEIDYGFVGHNAGEGQSIEVTDTVATLTNLEGGRSYSVFVRAVCNGTYSDWSEIRTFTTVAPPCAGVSGIHVREVGYSSVKIEWTPGSMSQTRWEVVFAKATDALPQTGVIVEGSPLFSPIGLTPQTAYKLKIRALCTDIESMWSDEFTFNTIQQGLEDVEQHSVGVYPNPSTGYVRFDKGDVEVEEWEIRDINGRIVAEGMLLPEGFDFEGKKGMFFVYFTTAAGHQIEKIIVR